MLTCFGDLCNTDGKATLTKSKGTTAECYPGSSIIIFALLHMDICKVTKFLDHKTKFVKFLRSHATTQQKIEIEAQAMDSPPMQCQQTN